MASKRGVPLRGGGEGGGDGGASCQAFDVLLNF